MAEILSIATDRRLLAWRPELDLKRWKDIFKICGNNFPQAVFTFAEEIRGNLTSFIAELRPGRGQQLLRPYSYKLEDVERATANRARETADLVNTGERAAAIELGIASAHDYFKSKGRGAQAILMSPINQDVCQPEYQHTAVYWLAFDGEKVNAWQLFLDLKPDQRPVLMRFLAETDDQQYSPLDDLELAATPVLFESDCFVEVKNFVSACFHFLGVNKNSQRFVEEQLELENRNRQEADLWNESYVHAITQGLLGTAKKIITNLQMKVRGITEFDVRQAVTRVGGDLSLAMQTFLAACGFLEFSFASSISGQEATLPVGRIALGGCEAKICRRCGTHAGDHDTKCPSCGWSP